MKNNTFSDRQAAVLARLGISDTPPSISGAAAINPADHRRNCHAWHLLCTKSRADLDAWLRRQSVATRTDMRVRLNRLRQEVRDLQDQAARA